MQVVINDQEESDEERCTCEGSHGHTHGHEHAHSTPRGIAAGLIDGLELPGAMPKRYMTPLPWQRPRPMAAGWAMSTIMSWAHWMPLPT